MSHLFDIVINKAVTFHWAAPDKNPKLQKNGFLPLLSECKSQLMQDLKAPGGTCKHDSCLCCWLQVQTNKGSAVTANQRV